MLIDFTKAFLNETLAIFLKQESGQYFLMVSLKGRKVYRYHE